MKWFRILPCKGACSVMKDVIPSHVVHAPWYCHCDVPPLIPRQKAERCFVDFRRVSGLEARPRCMLPSWGTNLPPGLGVVRRKAEAPGDIVAISHGLGSPREQYPRTVVLAFLLGQDEERETRVYGRDVGLRPQITRVEGGRTKRLWGRSPPKIRNKREKRVRRSFFSRPASCWEHFETKREGVRPSALTGPLSLPPCWRFTGRGKCFRAGMA